MNEHAESGVFSRKMNKKYFVADPHFRKTRQTTVPSE